MSSMDIIAATERRLQAQIETTEQLRAKLEQAEADARKAALEEAARVADNFGKELIGEPLGNRSWLANDIAADIRALAETKYRTDTEIKNTCPSCGRQSLFIGKGGWLTCSRKDCNPSVEQSINDLHAELREMRAARNSAINRLKEREAEYDLQIRAATIGVKLVTKMLETYQAEYVKMVECFRAANAAKRTIRALLFSVHARAEQTEADARRFLKHVDHDVDCAWNLRGDDCDCGLREMRAKYLHTAPAVTDK